MNSEKNKKPDCFGNLETVFPMGKDGLRFSPDSCRVYCTFRTECLKTAIESSRGSSVKEEMLDRNYNSGAIGFLERWSKRKSLYQKK